MAHVHLQDGISPEFPGDEPSPLDRFAAAVGPLVTVSFGGVAPIETTLFVGSTPKEQQDELPNLKGWLVPFAGIPKSTLNYCRRRPNVKLYSLHFNADATAEMAVGLLIAAARGLAAGDASLRKGRWRGREDSFRGVLLAGKTATILGYGAIGRRIGDIVSALGMKFIGVRRTFDPKEPHVLGIELLPEALAQSNALIIAAPGSEETAGMIGRDQIRMMRQPRLLVNVGRGSIVDEEALYEACRSNELVGAGLDVWYNYPPPDRTEPTFPSRFPFHELENVVLSPHRGGMGDDTERLRTAAMIEFIKQFFGSSPPAPVDLDAGY